MSNRIWKVLRKFLLLAVLACWLVPTGRAQNLTYTSADNNNSNQVFSNLPISTTSSVTVNMKTNRPGGGVIIALRFTSGTPTGQFTAGVVPINGQGGSIVNCYGLHNGVINAFTTSGSLASIPFQSFEQWVCPYVPGGTLGVTLNAFTSPGALSFEWVSTNSPFTINPLSLPWSYTHIATATTTLIKANSGYLHTVTINGGTAGLVTVTDTFVGGCGSGTTLAIIETIGATNPVTLTYDAQLTNGLCITTAAATDVTVTWK